MTDRRATAVVTRDGERFAADRAVIADVVAPHLYGRLVAPEDLPARTATAMRSFDLDPSTVKVDWALDGTIPWASPPPYAPGTFHVADSVEQMTEAHGQVSARRIPAAPFMLAGQMTTADPTRSPAGTESLWAYTHVPQPSRSVIDAGDGDDHGHAGIATTASGSPTGCRSGSSALAPGFGSRIVTRRVLGPIQLQQRDANLIGGAINGGTSQLHQELIFRPVPGTGTRRDVDPRPLPRVSVRPPRRRGARGARHERRPRRHRPLPDPPAHSGAGRELESRCTTMASATVNRRRFSCWEMRRRNSKAGPEPMPNFSIKMPCA